MSFGKNETGKEVCKKEYKKGNDADDAKLKRLKNAMKKNYEHHWYLAVELHSNSVTHTARHTQTGT